MDTIGLLKRPKDLDSQMMAGCSAFVFVSMMGFFLALWPFFAWPALWRWRTVVLCLVVGFLPSAVLGAIGSRKAGAAGATGYVASAMALAVFLFLRLDQARLSALASQTPELDYPASMGWLIPVGWILCAFVVAIAMYKEK